VIPGAASWTQGAPGVLDPTPEKSKAALENPHTLEYPDQP
jgi:hypothetical protein